MTDTRHIKKGSLVEDVLRDERKLFASRLYELELQLGNAFHTVNNENDCETASEQLDVLMVRISRMRGYYEALSDEKKSRG